MAFALCLAVGLASTASAYAAGPDMQAKTLALQGRVAKAKLGRKVIAALGDAYAGVWLEPKTALLHVGVTSAESGQVVTQMAKQLGFATDVVATPVRSTWAELIAAQNAWNRRLVQLLHSDDATTGLEPERNAVSISLSSSVSAHELAALRRDAANGSVNVMIKVESSPKLEWVQAAKKTCEAAFTSGSAFCEEAITAGVGIGVESAAPICTAGPDMIEGGETWMLTAGHCLGGETAGVGFLNTEVTSAYPAGKLKLVGKEGTRYNNIARDMGEVRVMSKAEGGFFAEAWPTPVPALVAEWVKSPKVPHAVEGFEEAMVGQMVCKEGMVSGEKCGKVLEVNVTTSSEHTFVASACGEKGDSGGPVYIEGTYVMLGITISINKKCGEEGAKTAFEPLIGFAGAEKFGIFGTFPKQELLIRDNETRPARKFRASSAPTKVLSTQLGSQVFASGTGTVTCTGAMGNGTASSAEALTQVIKVTYSGCEFSSSIGKGAATVSEAEYEFSADETVKVLNTITIKASFCTVTVKPQGPLSKVEYKNVGAAPSREIEEITKVTGFTEESALCGNSTTGTYTGSSMVKAEKGEVFWN
jgi:hypothetical protein